LRIAGGWLENLEADPADSRQWRPRLGGPVNRRPTRAYNLMAAEIEES